MNFDINGKIVNIVINLENYSLRKFNLDFKDLLKYQTKNEELDLNSNRQFDLKRIYGGILPIKYEDFQRIINLFLPIFIAACAIDKTPQTGLIFPSKASSPKNKVSLIKS